MLDRIIGELRDELPAELIAGAVRQAVPELPRLSAGGELLDQILRSHLASLFEQIKEPIDAASVTLSTVTGRFARDAARWGVGVDAVCRGYLAGHAAGLTWIRRAIAKRVDDPDLRIAVIERVEDASYAYMQAMIQLTMEEHAAARESATRGLSARRFGIARSILDGAEVADAAALSARLGYDLALHHVGFVVWSDEPDGGDDPASLERATRAWLTAIGFERPLVIAVDGLTVWAWGGSRSDDAPLGEAALAPGLWAAVGQRGRGIDGFRATHREAVAVRRLARRLGVRRQVVRHAELDTLALLDADPGTLRRYVARKLGGLAERGEVNAELRTTLRLYLRSGDRPRVAAAAGSLHRNTVARRVEQAVVRRGRPLDDDRVGLALALEIAALHGDEVLVEPR